MWEVDNQKVSNPLPDRWRVPFDVYCRRCNVLLGWGRVGSLYSPKRGIVIVEEGFESDDATHKDTADSNRRVIDNHWGSCNADGRLMTWSDILVVHHETGEVLSIPTEFDAVAYLKKISLKPEPAYTPHVSP